MAKYIPPTIVSGMSLKEPTKFGSAKLTYSDNTYTTMTPKAAQRYIKEQGGLKGKIQKNKPAKKTATKVFNAGGAYTKARKKHFGL